MFANLSTLLVSVLFYQGRILGVNADSSACEKSDQSECVAEGIDEDSSNQERLDIGNWIMSEGGFVDPRQEIRSLFPDMPQSPKGVFAKERIEKGDLILSVPWKLLIQANTNEQVEPETVLENWFCGLVENLAAEMKKGDDSAHAPYIRYLNGQTRGQILADYSEEAQNLFQEIVNPVMPWFQLDIVPSDEGLVSSCGIQDDPIAVHASLLVEQRSEDDLMVPYYDMYNHRNGKWLNTWINQVRGDRFDVTARKTIEAGEEIYNSYNQCNKCPGKAQRFEMGTIHIFEAYGFVESFPQRWFFGDDLKFDIDEQAGTDQLKVSWANMEDLPDESDAEYLEDMIDHIKTMKKSYVIDDFSFITKSEWDAISYFQDALLVALENAYLSASDIGSGGNGYY